MEADATPGVRVEHWILKVMPIAQEIAAKFLHKGLVLSTKPYGDGLVNDTFLVTTDSKSQPCFILQRINRGVFPQPEQIMGNLETVLRYIRDKQHSKVAGWQALKFYKVFVTRFGKTFFVDDSGDYWRALSFIQDSLTRSTIENLSDAEEVGFALGHFHRLVAGLDTRQLQNTLPGFHITPLILNRYLKASSSITSITSGPNSTELNYCQRFVDRHKGRVSVLEDAKGCGRLSIRAIHGDPKLNNFLFHRQTRKAVSIIDLDTVNPGLVHYDLGDCLRSCCNTSGEEPEQGNTVEFNVDICHSILKCYISECGDSLTAHDYDHFFDAIHLKPFELGIRFLTDYLEGNPYFKVESPEQNLFRAITQFGLAASIERQQSKIQAMVRELVRAA